MGPHAPTIAAKIDGQKNRAAKSSKTENSKLKYTVSTSPTSSQLGAISSSQDATAVRLNRKRKQAGGEGGAGAVAVSASGVAAVSAEPNAGVCDTMAPALTEPLSPTEKLSSSTAKAAPSTRSSKTKVEGSASSSTSSVNSSIREKRNRNSSTPTPSTSARVTRSKDAYQRVFEQAVSPTATPPPSATEAGTIAVATSTSPTQAKQRFNSNEQMGLSAALSNNNNNNNNNEAHTDPKTSVQTSQTAGNSEQADITSNCKPNSTEQLLADLTSDFEEAITAEICLRKQLREGNLSKATASEVAASSKRESTSITTESQNIVVIRDSGRSTGAGVTEIKAQTNQESQHMESQTGSGPEDTTLTEELSIQQDNSSTADKPDGEKVNNVALVISAKPSVVTEKKDGVVDPIVSSSAAANKVKTAIIPKVETTVAATTVSTVASDERENIQVVHKPEPSAPSSSRLQILAMEELPPISTDSTMTASEVEDNLEERLSQLDGTAIVSPSCEDSNTVNPMGTVQSTPPRTPTRLQLQQSHQQQVQQLQQQLQQTPPTPLSQQVQQQQPQPQHHLTQHTFTPQSSSSSINTLSSANLPVAFMKETAASELEDQDIEEVLKALKGFDGSAGADTLCDLNVLFNEVYTTLNYEEISSQPASTTTKPNPLKEVQSDIERKQLSMQRKIDFLLRRLRKLQARYMSKHTSEEIAGLFEWSARVAAGKGVSSDETVTALGENLNVIAARPPAGNWAEEKKNPVPSAQMSGVLRKLEQASNAQQLYTATSSISATTSHGQSRKSKKALQDIQASSSASIGVAVAGEARKGETVVTTLDSNVVEEMTHVAGLLQTEMREVQNAIDSDATESSSGGESADEMVTYNNQIQQPLSIAKRAAWRYSRDRAAIASRWSWLLSQIADLEIKIRQHSELHQEIVRTKGAVICGLEEQLPVNTGEAGTVSTATSSVNGYRGELCAGGAAAVAAAKIESEASLPGACRTRGYEASQFRKRKLFQTTNIHTISKKAARPSTIKCGCQWPLHPCALCTGRQDPTAPRDPPDTMMMADRVALLDPGYHPVLSFPEDVSNTLHLEAIARQPDWQQRVMRCQVKSIAKSIWKAEREAAAAAGHHTSKKYGDSTTKRRYIRKKDRIAAEEKNAVAQSSIVATTSSATSTTAATTSTLTGSTVTTAASTASSDAGNGTGSLTTSTTPLVANKAAKNSRKLHYHLVADGVLLEPPLSPVPTNNSSHSQSSHSSNSNYIHQTSDYPPQNYDPFNPNPAHSSLISSNSNGVGIGIGGGHKNNKYRKSSATTNAFYHNNSHYHYNNNSQYFNTNGNSEMNFLHTNDNWDGYVARSRTSSPTHGGSSNYHKYERSKNRSSYDIDNIVIPYSVAAATRVEILPYKEIPTPKWRVIEDEQNSISTEVTEEDGGGGSDGDGDILRKSEAFTESVGINKCGEPSPMTPEAEEKAEQKTAKMKTSSPLVKKKEFIETNADKANDKQINNVNNSPEMKNNNIMKLNNIAKHTLVESSSTTVEDNTVSEVSVEDPPSKKPKICDSVEQKDCATITSAAINKTSAPTSTDPETSVVTLNLSEAAPALVAMSVTKVRRRTTSVTITPAAAISMEDDDATEEDISDEAMMQRHERALTEERRKFQTYLKFPWSTRSRANRRIDSRAESSGANTPDPTSPAPNTPSVGGGDQESIPSPLAPSTPLNPLDNISEAGECVLVNSAVAPLTAGMNNANCLNKRLERRRTTSTKKDREPERRSSTPDPKELVPPYEPLEFPLSDEAFQSLLSAMPSDYCYADDSKYIEDCNNINNKYTRTRSSWRSDGVIKRVISSNNSGIVKSTMNCDLNNRRTRVNNNTASRKGGGARQQKLKNGKDINNVADELDDGEVENEEELEDGDYDYPKHHLAPDDDLFENTVEVIPNDVDDEYGAYVGGRRRMLLGDSEGESSETEPFPDDDPNDPEWKGESADRAERLRKSLR